MSKKVAVVSIDNDYARALARAVALLGGVDALNTPERAVTIKIGLFDPRQHHHTAVEAVRAIIGLFDQSQQIFLAESDNYCGRALDRLERFRDLFNERVSPASLSDDPQAVVRTIAGEEMALGHVLMKPYVLISTHVLRTFTKGSILKNLFGFTPAVQKARYHKNEIFANLIADIYEAAGGIDLAVLDGAYLHYNASEKNVQMNVLVVGRDALAVEVVGMTLAGLKPEKLPVIQEFARRGLGESDIQQIEIVGMSTEEFVALKKRRKDLVKTMNAAPKIPGLSKTVDLLAVEGWFDLPRCLPEVVEELKARGVPNVTRELVATTLRRRVGKNLEKIQDGADWNFRRKLG